MNIALVGEAWGEHEENERAPFVGPAGWLLNNLLKQVGINRSECLLTNVFNIRPPRSSDVKNFCGPKTSGIPGMPELLRGKYVKEQYAPQLDRLYSELRDARPNIIVALGATAAWALLHSSSIKSIRGAIAETPSAIADKIGGPAKVLPTYHPSAVQRKWPLRPVILADLNKVKQESSYPEFRRPKREIWLYPTLKDILEFETYLASSSLTGADIETKQNQITCIGFAPSPDRCIVIPFFGESGENYWPTAREELEVWSIIRRWLATYPTVFQNGMYDMTFLWQHYGIPVPAAAEDTMLLHHAMQPEMEKGLGFLGSIYTNEASWKFMSKGTAHD